MTSSPTDQRLPPAHQDPGTILCLPGAVATAYDTEDVIGDALDVLEPDTVVATAPNKQLVPPALSGFDPQVFIPGRGVQTMAEWLAEESAIAVFPPHPDDLPSSPLEIFAQDNISSHPGRDGGDTPALSSTQVVVVTDTIELTVDPAKRVTRLDGIDEYVQTLDDTWFQEAVTHVSTQMRPGYRGTYQGPGVETDIVVHGAGRPTSSLGAGVDDQEDELALLEVYPNGCVQATTVSPDQFGLQGLSGVSDTRARRLRQAGYASHDDVASAQVTDLGSIKSIGQETATTIQAAARAVAEGTVVPMSDQSLPSGDPIYIDLETDGLSGSTAWLVGVLDGDAATGNYMAFRERHPDDPATHLEAFMTWLLGVSAHRPVVAWNGYRFDFPILRDQLREHCPDYLDEWENRYQFDPLHWADRKTNAVLPGRSNKLETVAEALGYEPITRGLDGKTVADIYAAWRSRVTDAGDSETVPQPNWDRLETYCEDDVRALATIYEAMDDAARRPAGADSHETDDSSTRQGSLSDFS